MTTTDSIGRIVASIAEEYAISHAILFGSRANGTETANSDIDLIIEFSKPVTLMKLASLKNRLEELAQVPVDIIHGPIQDTDMIEIGKTVELYAA